MTRNLTRCLVCGALVGVVRGRLVDLDTGAAHLGTCAALELAELRARARDLPRRPRRRPPTRAELVWALHAAARRMEALP